MKKAKTETKNARKTERRGAEQAKEPRPTAQRTQDTKQERDTAQRARQPQGTGGSPSPDPTRQQKKHNYEKHRRPRRARRGAGGSGMPPREAQGASARARRIAIPNGSKEVALRRAAAGASGGADAAQGRTDGHPVERPPQPPKNAGRSGDGGTERTRYGTQTDERPRPRFFGGKTRKGKNASRDIHNTRRPRRKDIRAWHL